MPKHRKPAITGVARPEGFLDDIVRPVIQKGAKAVKSKVWVNQVGKKGKDSARVIEGRLFRTADRVEYKVAQKRAAGYAKSGSKGYAKMEDAIERKFRGRGSVRNSKKIDAGAYRYVLNQKKEEALRSGRSVRKTAKDYRSKYPKKK